MVERASERVSDQSDGRTPLEDEPIVRSRMPLSLGMDDGTGSSLAFQPGDTSVGSDRCRTTKLPSSMLKILESEREIERSRERESASASHEKAWSVQVRSTD